MSTVVEQLKELWQREIQVEPAPGVATRANVDELKPQLDELAGGPSYRRAAVLESMEPDERTATETLLAAVLARAATIAYAAGEPDTGARWLASAAQLAHDEELRAQLQAAGREPERYRMLVHGRYLIARDRERPARALWRKVARKSKDALAAAAKDELAAPRPVRKLPTLHRVNGIGAAFYGSRDRASDGSYVTTHCFSVFFVPLIPLGAYRVRDAGARSYNILAREQLSAFARAWRWGLLGLVAVSVLGASINGYINDPDRLARKHFDAALTAARGEAPEAALRDLDAALATPDAVRVPERELQQAGAEIVRLTAGLVPEPFTPAALDQVGRVVLRYQGLPLYAQGGAARDALLADLDGWAATPGLPAQAQLALLRHEADIADPARSASIAQRISAERLVVAKAEEADDPVAALASLVEDPADTAAMTEAGKVLARLADAPSLLDDNSDDVDAYLTWAGADPQIKQQVAAQRDAAAAGRKEAEADGVTRAKLEAMQKARPWDQRVGLALAHLDLDANKLDAADKRLRAFGAPNLLVRDARTTLAQIAMADGKLEVADQLASALLEARLPRFVAASGAMQTAIKRATDRLRTADVPPDLDAQLQAASEDERQSIFDKWAQQQIEEDPDVVQQRRTYLAYADVVPTSVLAGTIELRRAQALSGTARDAMLAKAEKAFLAVRTEAEGQPEFDLGLGEIYARLGKTAESDKELGSVLAKHDPQLTMAVANVYREIGRVERAKEIATQLYGTATSPTKEAVAQLLAVMNEDDDDQAEAWYRKSNQSLPSVKAALVGLEGRRLMRQGKFAECERKYAEEARLLLATAGATNTAAYNNAAVADQYRFACSGDASALADAEDAMEHAYRAEGDDPIVVANLGELLDDIAVVHAIAKRVDTRALRLSQGDADTLAQVLLESDERAPLLADLTADPGWRRAGDLIGQAQVLGPSRPQPYGDAFARAMKLRDQAAAAGVVDQLHHAKTLDTSDDDAAYKRWLDGTDDAKRRTSLEGTVAHYQRVLAGSLSPHSRAAALYLEASALHQLGTYWPDPDKVDQAVAAFQQAVTLWPALGTGSFAAVRLDAIATRLAPERWAKLRRERSPEAVLDRLAAANDPLAAQIRAAPAWADVVAAARAAHGRPGLDDLRLAKLIGDDALVTRDRAALDDPFVKLGLELAAATEPSSASVKDDLSYMQQR